MCAQSLFGGWLVDDDYEEDNYVDPHMELLYAQD